MLLSYSRKADRPKDGLLSKEQKLWSEFTVKAQLGIDIYRIKMNIEGEDITIELPPVKVLTEPMIVSDIKSISEKEITNISPRKRINAINTGTESLMEIVSNDTNLLSNAESRVKKMISSFIEQIGEKRWN